MEKRREIHGRQARLGGGSAVCMLARCDAPMLLLRDMVGLEERGLVR
jgi:hypothetical protein